MTDRDRERWRKIHNKCMSLLNGMYPGKPPFFPSKPNDEWKNYHCESKIKVDIINAISEDLKTLDLGEVGEMTDVAKKSHIQTTMYCFDCGLELIPTQERKLEYRSEKPIYCHWCIEMHRINVRAIAALGYEEDGPYPECNAMYSRHKKRFKI